MKIRRIAIVGGGTAGWMAANHLGAELSRDPEIEITLIESKDISVIGVGEGTVPRIRQSLQEFGISELDLITSCDVSFKQAIKFVNWLDKDTYGVNNFYYHPFSSPYPQGFDVNNYWLNNQKEFEFSKLSEIYSIAEANKSPKLKSSRPYEGVVDYAYHFNAAKFSSLLSKNAIEKFRVRHVFETIRSAKLDPDGSISSLIYDDGREEGFDFFIDCSGFSSVLIEKALNVPFNDKSERILTDSAVVMQEPTEDVDEIAPYTLATAHEAGWIWDIPLTTRRGVGFVYSSDHMNDSQVVARFSKYLGRDVENNDLKKVPMKIGYREIFWKNNCVALGLSQGFVEPLEATSILVTDFSANLLARNFPRIKEDIPVLSKYCNKVNEYTWERVIDFIQLHYLISDRRDSRFWVDATENVVVSDCLRERLDMWKIAPPKKTDLFGSFDMFTAENYLFVMYGMYYPTRPRVLAQEEVARSKRLVDVIQEKSKNMSTDLLSHRDWLSELKVMYEKMRAAAS